MRSTLDIIVAVKNEEEVSPEELKLALLAVNNALYFTKKRLEDLVTAVKGGKAAIVSLQLNEAEHNKQFVFNGLKQDPSEWLGPGNTPGTPEYQSRMAFAKIVVKNATGLDL